MASGEHPPSGGERVRGRRMRRFVLWVVTPLLLLTAAATGFRYFFPQLARQSAEAVAAQLLIRGLALRAGTGWPGEGIRPRRTSLVPMRDGVRLATDLYLPASDGPWPAILIRTPYSRGEGKVFGEFFCRYGYAVAVQDTRGALIPKASSTLFAQSARMARTLRTGRGNKLVQWKTGRIRPVLSWLHAVGGRQPPDAQRHRAHLYRFRHLLRDLQGRCVWAPHVSALEPVKLRPHGRLEWRKEHPARLFSFSVDRER